MSEENLNNQENQEVELSPVEQEALDAGWVPKDKFHGDEHKWVDAGEFLRRGELFKKIDLQNREIKEVRKALNELSKHHSQVKQVEYQRALETLKAQKKDALENGDADAVIAADERISMVRDAIKEAAVAEQAVPEQSGEEHPTFVEWKSKNQWYTDNKPMKAFADALGMELQRSGLSPEAVLTKVEQEVRKEFPHKFQNPRQSRPGALEGTTPRSSSSSSFQLTPEETKIMNTLVRQGALTKEQYIADLKKVKGV